VFACAQRLQRQVQMKPWRHRHDHCVDLRVVNRRGVLGIRASTTEPSTVLVCPGRVAAGVERNDVLPQRAQVPAVDAGDEAAPQERQAQGPGCHRGHHLDRYAARCANFVLVVNRIAVLAARSAAKDTGNQPRLCGDMKGRALRLV
jgi:hypothetical protein